ncbi:hypothetical protein NL676_036172 [Syzygium grande]|nr:hypothetical protein NL676_036172 [Syzygium grande]
MDHAGLDASHRRYRPYVDRGRRWSTVLRLVSAGPRLPNPSVEAATTPTAAGHRDAPAEAARRRTPRGRPRGLGCFMQLTLLVMQGSSSP